MKTLPATTFLAAFVAFLLFPLSFEIFGSALALASLLAITFSEYTRGPHPLPIAVDAAAARRTERLRLAA